MCGICGVLTNDAARAAQAVAAMNGAQAHRGPDDEGCEILPLAGAGTLALGHRRLSILDLSPAGHQPMHHGPSGNWLVFNGEIYNFQELRRELESHGDVFHSSCDTEAILHAYERWGTDCFARLEGMFAIALYDARGRRLVLARDPFGIKPLYFAAHGGAFLFASEVRALAASGLVPRESDRAALAGLLAYGAVQGPLTILRGARLLAPGVWAEVALDAPPRDPADLREHRFWDFPPPADPSPSRAEAVTRIRELLAGAAHSHLLSDVPVGIFLSSGLDSTAIASLCALSAEGPIDTFTVSLAGHPEMDENPVAAETARRIGARHYAVTLTEDEVRRQAERFLASQDQPTMDGLNTFIISWAVRSQGIKVAQSGLGGDEIFGGYPSFRDVPRLARWMPRVAWVPAAVRRASADLLWRGADPARRRKAREFAAQRGGLAELYFRRRRLFSDAEMEAFGLPAAALGLDACYLPPCGGPPQPAGAGPEAAVGMLESRFYMGNMLLRDSDVFGMAHGLEIRVPFLDRALTDYVLALPGAWRVSVPGRSKPLLQDAVADLLRPELRSLAKRGFGLPQAHWMLGPLRERFEAFFAGARQAGILEARAVDRVWQEFLRYPQSPCCQRAWMIGMVGSWLAMASHRG